MPTIHIPSDQFEAVIEQIQQIMTAHWQFRFTIQQDGDSVFLSSTSTLDEKRIAAKNAVATFDAVTDIDTQFLESIGHIQFEGDRSYLDTMLTALEIMRTGSSQLLMNVYDCALQTHIIH